MGLERREYSKDTIQRLHKAFRVLTKSGLNTDQALEKIRAEVETDETVEGLLDFIQSSERGIVK